MKMQIIKQEVFCLTCTSNTKQLRKERPDLVSGRDLRYKEQWVEVLEKLKALHNRGKDMSLADLEESEHMLKRSLLTVGQLVGLSNEQVETDWQRIKLEAQFGDIHIEEL
jgi:hypothetical protein